jgi:hypothetical protein
MATNVLADILKWSQQRPPWQRDALRRLFTSGDLTTTDHDQLAEICKAQQSGPSRGETQLVAERIARTVQLRLEPTRLRSVESCRRGERLRRRVRRTEQPQELSFYARLALSRLVKPELAKCRA